MAKQNSGRGSGGPSRIRFIMVEADLNEGDLDKVTQVLQNAFRTSSVMTPRASVGRLSSRTESALDADENPETFEEENQEYVAEPVSRSAKPRKASTGKVPTVLNDIDTLSPPSLKEFVAQFDVKTGFDKYLVIALWFRDGRSTNSITVDHVYTCFKLLGWSTKSTDFAKPLRNLRDNQLLSGDAKGYSLTLVGAGKIEEKKVGGS